MKTSSIWLLLLVSIAPMTVHAASIQLSDNTRIEVVESLTVRELWNATKATSVEAGGVVVDSRMFDSEARPREGKWRGCGIVMVGTGDIGIQPVAVRIWTLKPCDLTITAAVSSRSRPGHEFNMRLGSKEVLKMYVTSDLRITVNGNDIGRVKD